MIKFDKIFKYTFLLILFFEILSFIGYGIPTINLAAFFILVTLTAVISFYKLEYGVLIVLAELFIGSKGYLFNFTFLGSNISIRIALWSTIMLCWFVLLIKNLYQTNRLISAPQDSIRKLFTGSNKYYTLLFIAISFSAINGYINNNTSYVFLDFKRWIYFLLFFPLFSVVKTKENAQNLLSVFFASILALSLKTFILLFIFSHSMPSTIYELYRWVRETGVGEITQIKGGFYRVFFQSHIFSLLGLLITLVYLAKQLIGDGIKILVKEKNFRKILLLSIIFMTTILLSFSRSFWVGLLGGFIVIYLYIIFEIINTKNTKQKSKIILFKIFQNSALFLSITVFSLIFIVAIVKFPFPNPLGGFNPADVFSDRATETDEAAIGSRWALLPKLWQQIIDAPLLGKGFGSTVTYQTLDPRILQLNSGGLYTTYAFEWGWLDIWLKLGLIGTVAYCCFIFQPVYYFFKSKQYSSALNTSLIVGIIVLVIVNFFTPYLNHPLGIGYLALAMTILKIKNEDLQES